MPPLYGFLFQGWQSSVILSGEQFFGGTAKLVTDRLANHAEAIKLYERVLEVDPTDSPATEQLIALYEKRRDWDKLIALQPGHVEALAELAKLRGTKETKKS